MAFEPVTYVLSDSRILGIPATNDIEIILHRKGNRQGSSHVPLIYYNRQILYQDKAEYTKSFMNKKPLINVRGLHNSGYCL
jgi:hypothetical protein